MAADSWIELGYVARTHGVRGTVWIHWHDGVAPAPFPEQFQLAPPCGAPSIHEVKTYRRHKTGSLVDLAGVTSMEQAQLLKGASVRVAEAALPQEAQGEVYLFRLMHAQCRNVEDGTLMGTLQHIYHHGASVVLGIAPPAGGEELLVPLLNDTLHKRHPATGDTPQILDLVLLPDYFAP